LSKAVRASGFIHFKKFDLRYDFPEQGILIRQLRKAYPEDTFERERNNHLVVRVDMFGQNRIDYEPLEKILKANKGLLGWEVAINEWVETDGGLYFDPEEDEV
jgi:hypothetical protein